MKRLFSLLLILAIALNLYGCAPKEELPTPKLQAGFGRVDITPDFSVGLGGYGDAEIRRSKEVADKVYATCIALFEGDQKILLYTIDNCAASQELITTIRVFVSTATGVPTKNIYIGATPPPL